MTPEPVHSQHHYTALSPEPLDVIEAWEQQGAIGHHAACAIKYLARHRLHSTPRRDLEKARDYIDRLIERDYPESPPADTAATSPHADPWDGDEGRTHCEDERECENCGHSGINYRCEPCASCTADMIHWTPRTTPAGAAPSTSTTAPEYHSAGTLDPPAGYESKSQAKRVETLKRVRIEAAPETAPQPASAPEPARQPKGRLVHMCEACGKAQGRKRAPDGRLLCHRCLTATGV